MEKDASYYLENGNYKKHLECLEKICNIDSSEENLSRLKRAHKMNETFALYKLFMKKDLKDPYIVLSVTRESNDEEISASYKRLLLKFHPNRTYVPETGEAMKIIHKAYEMISDEHKRSVYQRSADTCSFGEVFSNTTRYRASNSEQNRFHFSNSYGDINDIAEIFEMINRMNGQRTGVNYRHRSRPSTSQEISYMKVFITVFMLVLYSILVK